MPSSHNEPHLSLAAPEPWHAAGRHVLTDGDEEPVNGVNALSRMAVLADRLGTCSSTQRQHQAWCCRVSSSNACFVVSRDPVLQLAGTNMGESPSSSTGPASPRIAQQHVNSAVNTKAPYQATLVPRTGYSWEGEDDTRCVLWPVKTTESGRSSVVSLRKHAISTACHRGRRLFLLVLRQGIYVWSVPAEAVPSWLHLGSNCSTRAATSPSTRKTPTPDRRDRRRPFPRTGPWGSCRASCPRHASN